MLTGVQIVEPESVKPKVCVGCLTVCSSIPCSSLYLTKLAKHQIEGRGPASMYISGNFLYSRPYLDEHGPKVLVTLE